jgi:hypothetical protein
VRQAARFARAAGGALLLALCSACATSGPLLLHPVPPTQEQYSLSQGAIVYAGPDFSVSVRPWDYRLLADEYRAAGEACPFGVDNAQVGRFFFFRVRIENRSTRTLVFNPMRSSVLREGEAPLIPLENSDLFAFMADDLAAAEGRAKAFRRTCFDITATIRPGQTLERYLVFNAPEEVPKQLLLELNDLWLDTKSFSLKFLFDAFPGK